MSKDPSLYYRNQISAYTESIRMCDFKANVAVIYGAFTIGPIMGFSSSFPHYIPLQVVLLPFVIVFFCLLICLLPRYPSIGRATLPIERNADPESFLVPQSRDVTISQQQTLCVILCTILYWKNVYLRISFTIYIVGTIIVSFMLAYTWLK